jgi:sulfate/thiosulfate-binding protein
MPTSSLALAGTSNIQSVSRRLPASWQQRLPHNSSPYTSTIVFLVRKGNPKGIHDWPDLLTGDVQIITPNPKTSGGARWNYLAAWGFALERALGTDISELNSLPADKVAAAQGEAEKFVGELYRRVPVQDTGARAATNTFVQRGIGDVLLAWENEALLAGREMGPDAFDIVWPSVSVLAEPPVALIDSVVDRKGTRAVAEGYLAYLYSPEGQDIVARNFFRPTDAEVAAATRSSFPDTHVHRRRRVRLARRKQSTSPTAAPTTGCSRPRRARRPDELAHRDGRRDLGHGDRARLGQSQRSPGVRSDARFRRAFPHVHRADPDGGADHEGRKLAARGILAHRHGAARSRVVPAHVWRLVARGVRERGLRLHHRLDARPV